MHRAKDFNKALVLSCIGAMSSRRWARISMKPRCAHARPQEFKEAQCAHAQGL